MTARAGILLWDFDGTLGDRVGAWSGALHAAAVAHGLAGAATAESYRPFLKAGYPWHMPDLAHPHLNEPDVWWAELEPVFRRAFAGNGCPAEAAAKLAGAVRGHYCDYAHWRLYGGAREILETLAGQGWRHVIVSNHVPELPEIVAQLLPGGLVEQVFTSGTSGYEKPHPEFFAIVVRALGEQPLCLIGDNPVADGQGAEAAGIPAILLRPSRPDVRYGHPDYSGVEAKVAQLAARRAAR